MAGDAAIDSLCDRPADLWDVEGPTLCHGYAGVLQSATTSQGDTGHSAATAIAKAFNPRLTSPSSTSTTACHPMNPVCSPDQPASPSPLQIMGSSQSHQAPPDGTPWCSSRDSGVVHEHKPPARVISSVSAPAPRSLPRGGSWSWLIIVSEPLTAADPLATFTQWSRCGAGLLAEQAA